MSHPVCKPPLRFVLKLRLQRRGGVFAGHYCWWYSKGIIHVRKFSPFDCYDILPALKQEVQFDAHEFHLALVSSLLSKPDAQ